MITQEGFDLWPVDYTAAAAELAGLSPNRLLATEDADQAAGRIPPATRLTCATCRTWASPSHLASATHAEMTRLRAGLIAAHADLVAAVAAGPHVRLVLLRMAAAGVRDRLAALLTHGRV